MCIRDRYVKEQEVIRREFAMGHDDPDRMASLALFATAFRIHPCRHPVIGYLDVFNATTRDQVMAYYKARYIPNNMFFVVVGDVHGEEVRAELEKHFAASQRVSLAPVFTPAEPPQLGRREHHEELPSELSRLHLAWHIPDVTHRDIPPLDLLAVALGGGRSSRLYKRLRDELALVHSISAWCYAPSHSGLFGVEAILDSDKRTDVRAEVLRALADLRERGITDAELAKAKKIALAHQFQQLTTMR